MASNKRYTLGYKQSMSDALSVKIGRNDTCPCRSGIKYKKCCMGKQVFFKSKEDMERARRADGLPLKEDNSNQENI